jgi:Fe2+ transport system protein FeoA
MTETVKPAAPTTLDALKPGGRGRIAAITGSDGISRRLLDMGATRGTLIEVERVAPLGDPIEVRIRGYHLTLRRGEAERILVTLV